MDELPLTFGKYKGQTPEKITEHDPSYIVWLNENVRPQRVSKELAEACEWDVREKYNEGYETLCDWNNGYFYKD